MLKLLIGLIAVSAPFAAASQDSDRLLRRLEHASQTERRQIFLSLASPRMLGGAEHAPRTSKRLSGYLEDADPLIRGRCATVLAQILSTVRDNLSQRASAMGLSAQYRGRIRAAEFEGLPTAKIVQSLRVAFGDPEDFVRILAVGALARLDESPVEALSEALRRNSSVNSSL
ncbi:MAG: hypothetical protein HYZ74_02565 [Elusimicrobia bacterium]|nr:hypothetical protein [Elusimicrobiota bacterium]